MNNSENGILKSYASSFVHSASMHVPNASLEEIARAGVDAAREAHQKRQNAEADQARGRDVAHGDAQVLPVNQPKEPFKTFDDLVGAKPGEGGEAFRKTSSEETHPAVAEEHPAA